MTAEAASASGFEEKAPTAEAGAASTKHQQRLKRSQQQQGQEQHSLRRRQQQQRQEQHQQSLRRRQQLFHVCWLVLYSELVRLSERLSKLLKQLLNKCFLMSIKLTSDCFFMVTVFFFTWEKTKAAEGLVDWSLGGKGSTGILAIAIDFCVDQQMQTVDRSFFVPDQVCLHLCV